MESKQNQTNSDNIHNKEEYFIIMGDIIKSSNYDYDELKEFRKITESINNTFEMVSPLTITLGDEFQGIATSLKQSIEILFRIEKELIYRNYLFELRYAIGYGPIITPINSEVAHGMYGEGLTKTREILENSKKDKRRRIDVFLPNSNFSDVLNELFFVYQSFPDSWHKKDYPIVAGFYKYGEDYKVVAEKLGKTKAQIWKREKNLRIREYFEMQNIILKLSNIFSILYTDTAQSQFYANMNQTISESLSNEKNIKKPSRKTVDKITSKLINFVAETLTQH